MRAFRMPRPSRRNLSEQSRSEFGRDKEIGRRTIQADRKAFWRLSEDAAPDADYGRRPQRLNAFEME